MERENAKVDLQGEKGKTSDEIGIRQKNTALYRNRFRLICAYLTGIKTSTYEKHLGKVYNFSE